MVSIPCAHGGLCGPALWQSTPSGSGRPAASAGKSAARNDRPCPPKGGTGLFYRHERQVYPAFAAVLGGQKPTIKVRDMTSRWGVCFMPGKMTDHLCIAALQHAACGADLCGGARVLPLPAAQPQPGLLGRGGKSCCRTGKTAGPALGATSPAVGDFFGIENV